MINKLEKISEIKSLVSHSADGFGILNQAANFLYEEEERWDWKHHIPSWSQGISSFSEKKANIVVCEYWEANVGAPFGRPDYYYIYEFDGNKFKSCSQDCPDIYWSEFKNSLDIQFSSMLLTNNNDAYLIVFGKNTVMSDVTPKSRGNGEAYITRFLSGGVRCFASLAFDEMDEAYYGINGLLYNGPWITPEIKELMTLRGQIQSHKS